ncbi:MAG: heavy metal translocating P-type ATPase metal-binding domain-containing protein [Candidatus Kapabacteria bacterium]|nr:heavy metal translocating P-type ATPase metal-binding domain-containing protein [Candidatus Kapabacteria bacterium]
MTNSKDKIYCYHCGDECRTEIIKQDDKYFCCNGCLFVYNLLSNKGMSDFYDKIDGKGLTPKKFDEKEFEFLEDKKIVEALLDYSINGKAKVTFYIPEIYCSACIWLLENLHRFDNGIVESRVNFPKKELSIVFAESSTDVRRIVELLNKLGYSPKLNLSDVDKKRSFSVNKALLIKLGVAGFAFGNVMLLAFPAYFSGNQLDKNISIAIGILNIILSLAVLYSASDYFKSAFRSLKLKNINIDIPISLGILVLFLRSVFEIATNEGPGYIDSMAGLVFFLLIGKVFQQKTFHTISFERDYKSFLPLSTIRIEGDEQIFIPLSKIKTGDTLKIRNNEIIPVDSTLKSDLALIDYSFVTGESNPVEILKGQKIYSGGKVIGQNIIIEAIKDFNQSYLTNLWNDYSEIKSRDSYISKATDTIAKYFTVIIILIALASFFLWLPKDIGTAFNALTAVLLVACPCAIALTTPFTYGTAMRIFAKNSFFLKNSYIVEYLTKPNTIVFDKTGTLTKMSDNKISFIGKKLDSFSKKLIKTAVQNSVHPLSSAINNFLNDSETFDITLYDEIPGKGIYAKVEGNEIRIGKLDWVRTNIANFEKIYASEVSSSSINKIYDNVSLPNFTEPEKNGEFNGNYESTVFVSINNDLIGYFQIIPEFRENLKPTLEELKKNYKILIITGDKKTSDSIIKQYIPNGIEVYYNQLPEDKVNFINNLNQKGIPNIMIGDGLNDAGALKAAYLGIAVAENTTNFTPGSDAIISGEMISKIPTFLKLAKKSMLIVYISFLISAIYNTIGISFAVVGLLTPVIAAILMPISSVSVVLFTVLSVNFSGKKLKLI